MVRHRIANPTLRKGRVGSTPTLSAKLLWCGLSVTASTRDCDSFSMGSIPIGHPKEVFIAVAHQVEQQTENLCVAGSSPARGTKKLSLTYGV